MSSTSVNVSESPMVIIPFSVYVNAVESLLVLVSTITGLSVAATILRVLLIIEDHWLPTLSELLSRTLNSIVLVNLFALLVGSSLKFLNDNLERANT